MTAGPARGELPKGLLALAIRRPVAVISCVILLVFFGTLSLLRLPIQLTPDISLPTVTVTTRWPGASPVEVESELIEPQEDVLKRVAGLSTMESQSQLGQGQITLEFSVGTDIEQALVRVSNQLSQVPSYPESADQPIVSTGRAAGPPLAVILIHDAEGASVAKYRTWIEESIVPELERVKGVASTRIRGGQHSEVHVQFDAAALAARGLTVAQVAETIRGALRNRSAGDFDVGRRSLQVRVFGSPQQAKGLEQVVVKSAADGTPIYLRDVATAKIGLRKRGDFAIVNQREAIALLPSREAGTNVLEVTEKLRSVIERLHEERFVPEGLVMEVVSDQTHYIYSALDQVKRNLLLGAGLAVVVLLLFLRSLAASAIVALAIPVCVLGTALGMTLLGRSVNVVSLAGITFAVGMVVDNSIVALENIDTWRGRVPRPAEAALRAIREVGGALVASTATTAAVFIPILTWQGQVGQLLVDIAYAVAISVIISLVVAVLVIPSMAALLLGKRSPARAPRRRSHVFSAGATVAASAHAALGRSVSWCTKSLSRSLLVALASVAASSLLALSLLPKMEYLPTGNRNLVFGIVTPAPGSSIDELMATGFENQSIMKEHTAPHASRTPVVDRSFFVGDSTRLFVGAVAEDPAQVIAVRDFLQGLHSRMPGVINFATQAALFSRGIGEGRSVELILTGADLAALIGTGKELFPLLRAAVPGARVRPVPVLDEGAAELQLWPREEQMSRLGLSVSEMGLIADAYIDGAIIGEYGKEGEPKLDVVLLGDQLGEDGVSVDAGAIEGLPVAVPGGLTVPLGTLIDIEDGIGPTVIRRVERQRSISLQVIPPDDVPFESAVDAVNAAVSAAAGSGKIPPSLGYSLGGSAGKLSEAQAQFAAILLVALIISYLLLAALFEDFLAPVAVLTVLPMAAAGGVGALWLVNRFLGAQPLDLVTALGFLILIGVVVNNAILIVDGAIARLRAGAELSPALTEAVRARVRPIFMSALTSLAGLTPLVLGTGAGSELYRGVGTVVLGGLALSTVLSLYSVPALFFILWSLRSKLRFGLKRP